MENQFTHAAYTEHLKQHRLMGSRDPRTGTTFLPPRPLNPATNSTEMEWVEFSGEATLETFTIIYVGTSGMVEAGYDRKNPYCVGIVKTLEGPKISALITGVNTAKPETIRIGTPLKVKFVDVGDDEHRKTILGFEPA